LAISWTTPTIRHEVSVAPQQVTATSPDEVTALLERLLCYWLIDQLPIRAHEELIPTLVHMRNYYMLEERPQVPRLPTGKPLRKLSRSTRPEVEIVEE
jgi:hypothetical protein